PPPSDAIPPGNCGIGWLEPISDLASVPGTRPLQKPQHGHGHRKDATTIAAATSSSTAIRLTRTAKAKRLVIAGDVRKTSDSLHRRQVRITDVKLRIAGERPQHRKMVGQVRQDQADTDQEKQRAPAALADQRRQKE